MAHEDDAIPDRPFVPQPTPTLLEDKRHHRSDAKLAARLIASGVVTEEMAELVLKRAFTLAGKTMGPREYAAAMGVPIKVAQLVMARERLDMEKVRGPNPINVGVQVNMPAVANASTADLKALEAKLDAFLDQPGGNGVLAPASENGTCSAPGSGGQGEGNGEPV
jgi:hypothetical protein